jgi:deazaflavin-dependent oxidoreductase (nitroreductase family)
MPAPRWLARMNRRGLNRITRPLAPHLPGFGVVIHVGRKSHREYRTPINVFKRPGGYTVALTYGPDSEWVKNVLASGGCTLITRGKTIHLTNPKLVHDEAQSRSMPPFVRFVLGRLNVADYLELTTASGAA